MLFFKKHILSLYIITFLLSAIATGIYTEYYHFIRSGTVILGFVCLFSGISFIIHYRKSNKVSFHIGLKLPDLLGLFLVFYIILRYFFSVNTRQAPERIIVYLIIFLSYFYVRSQLSNRKNKNDYQILWIIVIYTTLQGIFALAQKFLSAPNLIDTYQMGGTYGNPGELANVLVIGYCTTLGLLKITCIKRNKILAYLCIILLTVTIVLTKARTAWIAAIIGSCFIYRFKLADRVKKFTNSGKKKWLGSIVILGVLGYALTSVFHMKSDSVHGRLFIWKQCTELILNKPIFGYGYNSFPSTYCLKQADYFKLNPQNHKNELLADDVLFAYNDYLQFAVEYGLLGLLVLLVFLGITLLTDCNSSIHPRKHIAQGGIVSIIGCMFFSFPLSNFTILFILILLSSMVVAHDCNSEVITIKLNRSYYLPIASCISLIGLLVSALFIVNGYRWKMAFDNYASNDRGYIHQYEKIRKYLKYDKQFIYNYGYMLYISGNYEEFIHHYLYHYEYSLNTKSLLWLGDSYERTGNITEAIHCYTLASNIKPHLFVPKYKLFCLYETTQSAELARQIALKINSMKIKIPSKTVHDIKLSIKEYLRDNE